PPRFADFKQDQFVPAALVESFFGLDKYSEEVKLNLAEYERLKTSSQELSAVESKKLGELESYFAETPKYFADELAVKLQQIKLASLKGGEEG
ncbi:MAG: hypothetical protein AAFX06_34050, partial [Planctomycetota bacterium]